MKSTRKNRKGKGGDTTEETTEKSTSRKSTTAAKASTVEGAAFTQINFDGRKKSSEEKAVEWGEKANTWNQGILVFFGAISGILLLVISGYMSYLEAMNAADIIDRKNQFQISLGLSSMSALFSVIGFQMAARWWKYKQVGVVLPKLVKKKWEANDASRLMYSIMVQVIEEKRGFFGALAILFIMFNFITSAITYWAIVSSMPVDAPVATWIYTVAISFMCFVSGAGISLLTSPDVNEMTVISETQKRYEDYAIAQGAADAVVAGAGKK